MNVLKLNNSNKLLLNNSDISKLLSVSYETAKVTASRYCKSGYLTRIKRDMYILSSKYVQLFEEEIFTIANILQTPSYISLLTALSYYNISTQQQRNFIESIAIKRTKKYVINGIEFNFTLIKKELYNDFILKENIFIAKPDKAFADIIYLTAQGKYSCDFSAINIDKINFNNVKKILQDTNKVVKQYLDKICKT